MDDTLIMKKVVPEEIEKENSKETTIPQEAIESNGKSYEEEVAEMMKSFKDDQAVEVKQKDMNELISNITVLSDCVKRQTDILDNVAATLIELKGSIEDLNSYYATNNKYVESVLNELGIQNSRAVDILETVNKTSIKVVKLQGVQNSVINAVGKIRDGVNDTRNVVNNLDKNVSEVREGLARVSKETEVNREDTERLKDKFEKKTNEIERKLTIIDKIKGLFT